MPPDRTAATRRTWLALAFAITFPTFVTWLYFIALHGTPPALQQGAYAVGKGIQFAFPLVWVLPVYRLHWGREEELPKGSVTNQSLVTRMRGVLLGAGFGLLVTAAGLWLYFAYLKPEGLFNAAAHEVREKVDGMGLGSPAVFIAMAVFYSLVHSLLEEYYWRWFVFGQLDKIALPAAAVAISSLGFAAHHVLVLAKFFGAASPATYLCAAAVAVGGAAWAWLYRRSGSLLGPWISHALVDAMIFAIGYDLVST